MANEDQIPPEVLELMTHPPNDGGVGYDWLQELVEMVDKLNHNSAIELESFTTHPPVGLFVRETLSEGSGVEIPDQIMSFYKIVDGFEIKWTHRESDARGHIRMCGFGEVFGNWTDSLWGVVPEALSDDEDEVDFSWELRGIDDGGDHEFMTVMHTPESMPSFSLYFRNPVTKSYRLNVDFLQYLDTVLETRGIDGWQYLVSDVNYEEDAEALEHAQRVTSSIEALFPTVDLSKFNVPT